MANPVSTSTLDAWITDRIPYGVATPKGITTGAFDTFVTAQQPFTVYVAGSTFQSAWADRSNILIGGGLV